MSKEQKVLSLDISGSCTGWSFLDLTKASYTFGTIKTKNTMPLARRLDIFRKALYKIIDKYKPSVIIIEDTFVGRNPAVNKMLSKFGGVAEQLTYETLGAPPVIISNKTVKSFFCVKKKEQLFILISSILGWPERYTFKKYNDISDSIAQLMYFIHTQHYKNIKEEKDYGYIYK